MFFQTGSYSNYQVLNMWSLEQINIINQFKSCINYKIEIETFKYWPEPQTDRRSSISKNFITTSKLWKLVGKIYKDKTKTKQWITQGKWYLFNK